MLLISTRLAPSSIHGLGVFATAPVAAGDALWRFEPDVDQVISNARAAQLPRAFQDYLATYAYHSPDFPDAFVLSCDHAKFLNHAEDPNTTIRGRATYARRDIAAGDEITCDYRLFVDGWTGFD